MIDKRFCVDVLLVGVALNLPHVVNDKSVSNNAPAPFS